MMRMDNSKLSHKVWTNGKEPDQGNNLECQISRSYAEMQKRLPAEVTCMDRSRGYRDAVDGHGCKKAAKKHVPFMCCRHEI